jgi:replicative DNA helicase
MSDLSLERVLPNNLEAERAILGAVLLHAPALYEASECLSKDDLYMEAHRRIWGAFGRLQAAESAIDQVTLISELRRSDELEASGGAAYILQLTDGIPRALNVRHYAGIVHEEACKRRIIQISNDAMARAYANSEDSAKAIIDDLQLQLLKLTESSKRGGWRKIMDLVSESYQELEALAHRKAEITGLDTGFRDLNVLTQGFQPGQLIIIAGRPGHGKSSLGLNIIATNILKHSKRIGLFTIEMSAKEITKRIMYSEAEVDSHKVGAGYITKDDWNRITAAAGRLADTNLNVDESGSLTMMELRSRAQQLAISGVDLLVVDYLQLMSGGSNGRQSNRVQEISDISRGLKQLAKDINIPIVAMSQLNRQIEQETKRRPRLADLRESGSIEQDADVVLFIWREELRDRREENIGQAELIIGKQRNGPVGSTVNLTFLKQFTKFVSGASKTETDSNPELWYQREL